MDHYRIGFDLDGVICEIRKPNQTYAELAVIPGIKELIDGLVALGHEIVICTARNMQSCGQNTGKAVKNYAKITLDWLDKNAIHYDEIWFGKPNTNIMIDDRALTFTDCSHVSVAEILQKVKER